jgi:hypothetical protein
MITFAFVLGAPHLCAQRMGSGALETTALSSELTREPDDVLMVWPSRKAGGRLQTPSQMACILFSMDDDEPTPLRTRTLREIRGIAADGAYASLLAIPVAIGVAAYTFAYLSLLRHRLRRRAADSRTRSGADGD